MIWWFPSSAQRANVGINSDPSDTKRNESTDFTTKISALFKSFMDNFTSATKKPASPSLWQRFKSWVNSKRDSLEVIKHDDCSGLTPGNPFSTHSPLSLKLRIEWPLEVSK